MQISNEPYFNKADDAKKKKKHSNVQPQEQNNAENWQEKQ